MKVLPSLILLTIAAPSFAQSAAKPAPAPSAATARPKPPTPTKVPGVSEAGNALLAKQQTTPDPQLGAIIRQQRTLHDQLVAAVMAPAIDVEKVEALLRQGEALQGQLRTRQNDRLLEALRLLPEPDRGPFLRALIAPAGSPSR